MDKVTLFHEQGDQVDIIDAPWDKINEQELKSSLLEQFNIKDRPQLNESYKPLVLLFDEYYTNLYQMDDAQQRMKQADKMVFMGTSFSVNITNIALDIAMQNQIEVEVVDPDPVILPYKNVRYIKATASQYIQRYG